MTSYEDVLKIQMLYESGKYSIREIARIMTENDQNGEYWNESTIRGIIKRGFDSYAPKTEKICSRCGETKPIEDFTYGRTCKKCYARIRREQKHKNRPDMIYRIDDTNTPTRLCNKCGRELNRSNFEEHRGICRDCYNEYRRELYARNVGESYVPRTRYIRSNKSEEELNREREEWMKKWYPPLREKK